MHHNRYDFGEVQKAQEKSIEGLLEEALSAKVAYVANVCVKLKNEPDINVEQACYRQSNGIFVIEKNREKYLIPIENILFVYITESQNDSQTQNQ